MFPQCIACGYTLLFLIVTAIRIYTIYKYEINHK